MTAPSLELIDQARRYHSHGRRVAREQSLERLLGQSSQMLERILATDEGSLSATAERRDLAVVLADELRSCLAIPPEVLFYDRTAAEKSVRPGGGSGRAQ